MAGLGHSLEFMSLYVASPTHLGNSRELRIWPLIEPLRACCTAQVHLLLQADRTFLSTHSVSRTMQGLGPCRLVRTLYSMWFTQSLKEGENLVLHETLCLIPWQCDRDDIYVSEEWGRGILWDHNAHSGLENINQIGSSNPMGCAIPRSNIIYGSKKTPKRRKK
jgi:hypothetical protein